MFFGLQGEEDEEEEGAGSESGSGGETVSSDVVLGAAGVHEGQRVHSPLLQSQLASQTSSLQRLPMAQRNPQRLDVSFN